MPKQKKKAKIPLAAAPKPKPAVGSPPPPAAATSAAASNHVSITVSGPEHVVRRTLASMSFHGEWNRIVTREIARGETLVSDAGLDDTLGGPKLRMFSQDVRDLYVQRCANDAARAGHPVPDPSKIPADAGTTVMEVGDALFDNSVH